MRRALEISDLEHYQASSRSSDAGVDELLEQWGAPALTYIEVTVGSESILLFRRLFCACAYRACANLRAMKTSCVNEDLSRSTLTSVRMNVARISPTCGIQQLNSAGHQRLLLEQM